jgi:GTP-binding protein
MAYAPVLPLSAKEGEGVDKLVTTIVSVYAQLTKRIETSKLNKAIETWVEETPPPIGVHTHFKLRYAVQTSVNPQKFTIFISRPEAVAEAYVAFLRNKIRTELGMDKIPLILEIKASHTTSVYEPLSRAEKVRAAARPSGPSPASIAAAKAARKEGGAVPKKREPPVSSKSPAAKKKASVALKKSGVVKKQDPRTKTKRVLSPSKRSGLSAKKSGRPGTGERRGR